MIKKREKCKKELLQLTIDILDKRYDMEDYTGTHLNYAEAQKVARSAFYPIYHDQTSKVCIYIYIYTGLSQARTCSLFDLLS